MKKEIESILDGTILNEEEKKGITEQLLELFQKSAAETVEQKLGQFVSDDTANYPKIIAALKKELKKSPDKMADDVEFDKGDENEVFMESIAMWEPLEYTLSVKNLCELIGIE